MARVEDQYEDINEFLGDYDTREQDHLEEDLEEELQQEAL